MYYKKIFFTGACALTLISSFGIQALAYEPLETSEYLEDGTVFMVNIKGAGCDLKITSGKAHISCYVDGKLGTSTSITAKLQQKNKSGTWINISTWSNSKKSSCSLSKDVSVSKGHSYRLSVTVKAGNESKTIFSPIRVY